MLHAHPSYGDIMQKPDFTVNNFKLTFEKYNHRYYFIKKTLLVASVTLFISFFIILVNLQNPGIPLSVSISLFTFLVCGVFIYFSLSFLDDIEDKRTNFKPLYGYGLKKMIALVENNDLGKNYQQQVIEQKRDFTPADLCALKQWNQAFLEWQDYKQLHQIKDSIDNS
jgi:hypothetical protein